MFKKYKNILLITNLKAVENSLLKHPVLNYLL